MLSFASYAERKKITLKFNSPVENLKVYVDKDKLEKIVSNLLSNALKFTPDEGRVDVKVEKLSNSVKLKIVDNGIGIPKERIDKIFDRFYQVDGSHTRENEGIGIGLALTKELVELHRGKIEVDSQEGKGTTITLTLPSGKEHLTPDEICVAEKDYEKESVPEAEIITENKYNTGKTEAMLDSILSADNVDKPLLLIIEDNSDVRNYITEHLEKEYRIIEAADGEEGLQEALKHIPDIIVSDLMMPKLDGFQLCAKVKTDERTSHIPVIMLTAKANVEAKIEGYELGADDYIMKPFDIIVLKARIKNLIGIRKKLQEKFSADDFRIPKELSAIDEQFLTRVLGVIDEHISDENFNVEILSRESAMSREQVFKKLKALTGKSPTHFLRSIRLTKAKRMIKEQKGSISEISYLVGFNSPAYFTKCFKEEFGYSPSELLTK